MKAIVLLLLMTCVTACRRNVDGFWTGRAGGEELELRIEQVGSSLEGDVCTSTECTPIVAGSLDEREVELAFGCDGCALPETTLNLVLDYDRLVGEAHLSPCRCNDDGDDCDCRVAASFSRCDGACVPEDP